MNFNLFYILGFCNYCIEFLFFPVHTQYCCRGTVIWNMFNFSFCTTVFYKKRGKTNKKSWFPEKQLIKKKKKKKKKSEKTVHQNEIHGVHEKQYLSLWKMMKDVCLINT